MFAVSKGDVDLVELLLLKAADPNLKDSSGRNVLAIAEEWQFNNLVRMFEDMGMRHRESGVRVPPHIANTRPKPPFAPVLREDVKFQWSGEGSDAA